MLSSTSSWRSISSCGVTDGANLDDAAAEFAAELTSTVQELVPDCAQFTAEASDPRGGVERVRIRQEPNTGIDLPVNGKPLINLKVSYFCTLDRARQYLAVERSEVIVRAAGDSEPLIRFDYLRYPKSRDIPGAHIQVHAQSDTFGYLTAKAGEATSRGRRRARSGSVPRLSELHLPVGGSRFRPCLEDVLEILVNEFGIDCTAQGMEALRLGREKWRTKQIATVVRDCPETAADVLRDLEYVVSPPPAGPRPPNPDRLREL